jgi:hypothetical protein
VSLQVPGIVTAGYGVASGRSAGQPHNPYPAGTIAMQAPYFANYGVDLSGLQLATLNLSIAPHTWVLKQGTHCIEKLEWTHLHPPETFTFVRLHALWQGARYAGWLYWPHPETKAAHFQNASVMELILPPLKGIVVGSQLSVEVDASHLQIDAPARP